MATRLGCSTGLGELKAHPYFAGFNWSLLEMGEMDAAIKPNVNDINAPSAKEIDAFKPPKDVEWTPDDQAKFATWDYVRGPLPLVLSPPHLP